MKNVKNTIAASLFLCAVSMGSQAQVSATALATATIVTPIAIAKTADMNFGNVAVSTTAGTVVLTPAAGRTATGGVTLPATVGTVAAAAFDVTGIGNYTYSITLPSSALVLTRNSGTETMNVNTFASTPSGIGTLASGAQSVTVGATLNVAGSQTAGVYVSATPFTVTVNYN